MGSIIPNKVSIFEYYIKPLIRPFCHIKRKLQKAWYLFRRDVLHYWYCDYCKVYHSGRTIAYDYSDGQCDMVCSAGKYEMIAESRSLSSDPKKQMHEEDFIKYVGGEMWN